MKRTILIGPVLVILMILSCGITEARGPRHSSGEYLAAVSGFSSTGVSSVGIEDHLTSNWYVTETGYIAAIEEELLDRAIFWAGFGDEQEFERFIASSPLVFPLRGGLRVYVEKFSFCGKVKIRPEGSSVSVWTIREAIRSEMALGS
ncbi:MAG: hypothetical protein JRD47_01280 [Deltaproteobacteria bacterium]|nr:hypothetical protein [Deltaproteobacteria bacterium]